MMICVSIKGPTIEDAHHQIQQAVAYAEMIELRLDCFHAWDSVSLCNLRSQFSLPMILTLRSSQQGGCYDQSEQNRLMDLLSLAAMEPEYLDLEYHVPRQLIQEIASNYPNINLILSYHNFSEVPLDLESIYEEMQKIPASLYKIAVTPQNSVDAMRLLCWAKEHEQSVIAIGMGSYGQLTRILGPLVGCPFVYACVDDVLRTAPGQITAKLMVERYRHHSINPNTIIYGLIGDPVSLSISDETHNHLLGTKDINAVYIKIQIATNELPDFLDYAKQLPFRGLSVTMPLKESIVQYLDSLDPHAMICGAVNTLHFDNGKIFGFNTDGIGALDVIESRSKVCGKRLVIIGAGGAARAIAYEAIRRGAHVTVVNRHADKAREIASILNCNWTGLDEFDKCASDGYEFLINCTPVSLPIDPQYIIPHAIVMDIGTKPKNKELLKLAAEKKCQVLYGYQMFVEQALGQFNQWFNGCLDIQETRSLLLRKAEDVL